MRYRDLTRVEEAGPQSSEVENERNLTELAAAVGVVCLIVAVAVAFSTAAALVTMLVGVAILGAALLIVHPDPDLPANEDTTENAILDPRYAGERKVHSRVFGDDRDEIAPLPHDDVQIPGPGLDAGEGGLFGDAGPHRPH